MALATVHLGARRSTSEEITGKRVHAVINKFVSKATEKVIPEVLKRYVINGDTKVVKVDANYLKARFAKTLSEIRQMKKLSTTMIGLKNDIKFRQF
ncbi:hypothetical protein L596_030064 [Steinernema carpocapsae]|uniref:Uncharacterized protein n=1 Tax=Steinernema carpocapsae TaxID=34508 RepID=A0A4U5LRN0_STECR|nr:hypothetical protein L596_030064 [Steinernema carpocapsae]